MGNKIILISSYCDNDEKLKVLDSNLKILKNLGFDIMLNSPIDLPFSVTSQCDFYIRTNENPVFDWPDKCVYTWADYKNNSKRIRVLRTLPDYGWANIYQVKKLSEYALTYDYDYFYHIIYDLVIDEVAVKELLSDSQCKFYHFHEHLVSLHMMLFDRKNLSEFTSNISLKEYLEFGGIAETWLENYIQKSLLKYTVSSKYVEDHILYHRGIDLFNYSEFYEFKLFITNNTQGVELYFYDMPDPVDVMLEVNSTPIKYKVRDRDIINLGCTVDNVKSVRIQYDGSTQDLTQSIMKITHNRIEIYE